jgi:hypothetical protein
VAALAALVTPVSPRVRRTEIKVARRRLVRGVWSICDTNYFS